jgi:cobalt-precorrin-5B (C1)-methyltransferase
VGYADDYAYCIKEAGDDPDVTDSIEVRAKVEKASQFEICGGVGVGRFTLPGFDYPVGEPAINKAPRQMMRENLTEDVRVTISVPQGETIARKTFNPRLGIRGGISIIGVSGVVKPFSEEAFIESIRKCMEVAKASGTDRVVINSGAKSERFVKAMFAKLPQQAFVQYGNYIGETLTMANHLGIKHVTLGVMLGKAVKLAAGHLDTHSRKTVMDMAFVQQMLNESGISINISDMTLARELWERIAEEGKTVFARTVIRHCYEHCAPLLPNGELLILLIDDKGKIYEG